MITKYGFSEAVALNSKPHANVVFHRNEKHFGNTIQVNETGDTLTHGIMGTGIPNKFTYL